MHNRPYTIFLIAIALSGTSLFGQEAEAAGPSEKDRFKQAENLRDGGVEAIPSALPLLSDPDQEVRLEAVRSIVHIGTQHSIDPLITATRDNDAAVQMQATDGLVNFYVPGYVPTGVAKITSVIRGRFDRENRDVVDSWITVRPDVIVAIGKLASGGSSMESRANAARALGILRGKEAVPELLEALRTKETVVLYETLLAFQKIGDQSVGQRIMPMLRDPVERVQIAAIESVGLLRTKEAVPDLQRVFDSTRKKKVRRAALTSLAMLPDPTSRPYYERAFQDKDELVRAAAAEGYARLNQPADVPAMQKAFDTEKKMPARLAMAFALVALGQTQIEEFAPLTYLVNTLNSRQYKGVAEPYLIELARQPKVRVALYQFVAKATGEEKMGLARVFSLTGDKEAIPQIEWISKDPDSLVAQEGLRALKVLRARLN